MLIYALANFGKAPLLTTREDFVSSPSTKQKVPSIFGEASPQPASPVWFSASLSNLTSLLLQPKPAHRRLNLPQGMANLFSHAWFTSKLPQWTSQDSNSVFVDGNSPTDSVIDVWRSVLQQRIQAPYLPDLTPGLSIACDNFDAVVIPKA